MWKPQKIYLLIKTQKFKWFVNGSNKLPLSCQFFCFFLTTTSWYHRSIWRQIFMCDFPQICWKEKVQKSYFWVNVWVKDQHNAIQGSHMTDLRKKISRNTFIAELLKIKVEKWNCWKLTMRFEVTPSCGV